jgi:hypothetical protein
LRFEVFENFPAGPLPLQLGAWRRNTSRKSASTGGRCCPAQRLGAERAFPLFDFPSTPPPMEPVLNYTQVGDWQKKLRNFATVFNGRIGYVQPEFLLSLWK